MTSLDYIEYYKQETKQDFVSKAGEEFYIPFKITSTINEFVDTLSDKLNEFKTRFIGRHVIINTDKTNPTLGQYASIEPKPGHLAKIRDVTMHTITDNYRPDGCSEYFNPRIPHGYRFFFILEVCGIRDRSVIITKWFKVHYDDVDFVGEYDIILPYSKDKEKYIQSAKKNDIDFELIQSYKNRTTLLRCKDAANFVHFKMIHNNVVF